MYLTSEHGVETAGPEEVVHLARGCNAYQLGVARGHASDAHTTAPSEEEARAQVGEMPCFGKLIEFTTDEDVARRFGTGGYVIGIAIKRKYLTKGSVSEAGWICRDSAPFDIESEEKGRSFRH
ncbi:MAG: DUF4765 family protein [Myxococcales bacterium]|nr:DUF4765 family protein [Myxococcales bacterium]